MSNKVLQRLTESVSYIGQLFSRQDLESHRNHISQEIGTADQRRFQMEEE